MINQSLSISLINNAGNIVPPPTASRLRWHSRWLQCIENQQSNYKQRVINCYLLSLTSNIDKYMLNQGEIISVKLDQLKLDPNNYRFVDNKNYKFVSADIVADERIQNRSFSFIVGDKRQGIRDLITSFKENGYLSVDQIQVKPIENNNYLVLEGNRRVSALIALKNDYDNNLDIGRLDPSIFNNVPVVTYENTSESDFYVLTGLKHIEGNRKWPTVNQAQLVSDLVGKYGLSEDEVIAKLGTSKIKVRRYIRTLSLIQQYIESDYGDQFSSDMYSVFEEIIKSKIML